MQRNMMYAICVAILLVIIALSYHRKTSMTLSSGGSVDTTGIMGGLDAVNSAAAANVAAVAAKASNTFGGA